MRVNFWLLRAVHLRLQLYECVVKKPHHRHVFSWETNARLKARMVPTAGHGNHLMFGRKAAMNSISHEASACHACKWGSHNEGNCGETSGVVVVVLGVV